MSYMKDYLERFQDEGREDGYIAPCDNCCGSIYEGEGHYLFPGEIRICDECLLAWARHYRTTGHG